MRSFLAILFCTLLLAGGAPNAAAAEVFHDPGFTSERVAYPIFAPVGVAWAPDGRMFYWQRNGIVGIITNGVMLETPFLNFSAKVNQYADNGMWSLAFDPGFTTNRYIYISYVHETNGTPTSADSRPTRLVRVQASASNPNVMQPGSEVVLLDHNPVDGGTHAMGTIRFHPDGTMYVSNGDGAHPGYVDPNSWRSQDLDTVSGKILRLNAPDGTAVTNNPFYDGSNSPRSKVWCYGVRNPHRFSFHPTLGVPYFADVGWVGWEELNRGVMGGNYGWPCYEGAQPHALYQAALSQCASLSSVIMPMHAYSHYSTGDLGNGGGCIIGGDFYMGDKYPAQYRTNYFYADITGHWIHRAVLDGAGNLVTNLVFATNIDYPAFIEMGPDGYLYYPAGNAEIRRIIFTGGVTAVAAASPTNGYSPLNVTFSSAGSTNGADGSGLTYFWSFGDGTTSTNANPSHTYTTNAVTTFIATLTVCSVSNTNLSASDTVAIQIGSLPPVPTILAPTNNSAFMPGQTVAYEGSGTDPEDGALPGSSLTWQVRVHTPPNVSTALQSTGAIGSFVLLPTNSPYHYELILTANDSTGLATPTNVLVQALADTNPPTTPNGLSATGGVGLVSLAWNASTDNAAVRRYRIERQGGGNTNFVEVGATTNLSFISTGLSNSTTYGYRVRAEDYSSNLSGYSDAASATTSETPPSTGPVAAYSFDEAAGTNLTDFSGNANHGQIVSATWTNGRFGSALQFNGSSSLVIVSNSQSLTLTNGMTLEAWVYPAFLDWWMDVIYKGVNDIYYLMANSNLGTPATGGTWAGSLLGPSPLPLNTWSHLAGTYDGTTLRLYVNGAQVASQPQSGLIDTSSGPLTLGGDPFFGQFFNGRIDEVRIYHRALSLEEIQADMNTSVGAAPLVSLGAPTNGAVLVADAASILLNATASDPDGSITRVEFHQGASLIQAFSNAPYAFTWTGVEPGVYTLAAIAFDNTGLITTSAPVVVTVNSNAALAYGLTNRPAMAPYLAMPAGYSIASLPQLLSETGAFLDTTNLTPAAGVLPFDVNTALWSDAAAKWRWLAVPFDGAPVTASEQIGFATTGEWTFPEGTVFVKHFELATNDLNPALHRRLETRLLVRGTNGGVYGVTYKWRPDNSDADLLTNSLSENILITTASGTRTQSWYYPSPADCLFCHQAVAGHVLGVKSRQLNGEMLYPATGVTDNQLRTLNRLGLLNPPISDETAIAGFTTMRAITNLSASLEERTRSYLDANCANCHRPGGIGPSFDARYDTPLTNQNIINGSVSHALGIDNLKVVTPRDVWRSAALIRMETLTSVKMPPIARNLVDTNATVLLAEWINSLDGVPALAPPAITPQNGSYNGSVTIALSHTNGGAVLYYTMNGSTPTTNSALYAGPFALTNSGTLKAVATAIGFNDSVASSASYSVIPFPQVAASYSGGQLTLSWPDNGVPYALEFTDSLLPPVNWTPVTESPVLTNGQAIVTLSTTNQHLFYRLKF